MNAVGAPNEWSMPPPALTAAEWATSASTPTTTAKPADAQPSHRNRRAIATKMPTIRMTIETHHSQPKKILAMGASPAVSPTALDRPPNFPLLPSGSYHFMRKKDA